MVRKLIIALVIIPLVIMIVIQSNSELSLYIWFYLNRAEITENYCVNKDKPDMHCNGKCYLKKLIKQKARKKNDPKIPSVQSKTKDLFFETVNEYHLMQSYLLLRTKVIIDSLPEGIIEKVFRPPIMK